MCYSTYPRISRIFLIFYITRMYNTHSRNINFCFLSTTGNKEIDRKRERKSERESQSAGPIKLLENGREV